MSFRMQTERSLTLELKRKMDESGKFTKVYVWKRPRQSRVFMERWLEIHGGILAPPVQPDMDMIVFWRGLVIGIEVKYFRRKGKRLGTSFYEGIDQAVALLGWGFDHVALWQLFEESATAEHLWFYGIQTWVYLQRPIEEGGLGLPLGFTLMKVSREANGLTNEFYPINPVIRRNRLILVQALPLYHPDFHFSVRHPNPLMSHPHVANRKKVLLEWLETQEP
jgi:hypothetical protein